MTLPAVTVLKYNGITFNSHTRTSISATPVPSLDQSTIQYVEYTLTATSYVYGSDENDMSDHMSDIRDRLTQAGGQLAYKGIGFDDLTVNVGNVKDVTYGP